LVVKNNNISKASQYTDKLTAKRSGLDGAISSNEPTLKQQPWHSQRTRY